MTNLMIPGPGDAEPDKTNREQSRGDDHGTDAGAQRQSAEHANESDIPNKKQCLRAIAQVARLVALGLLKPSQGTCIRAAYREILQFHDKKEKEADKGISNVDVLDLLRKDPKMLSLLEPLLGQAQIDLIMKNAGGSGT